MIFAYAKNDEYAIGEYDDALRAVMSGCAAFKAPSVTLRVTPSPKGKV